MKKAISTSVLTLAVVLMLSVSSCKNDPEVNIPLVKYILIDEQYLDGGGEFTSGFVDYSDSLAMTYNNDMQLVSIDGFYEDYELFYDNAGRLSKTEIYEYQPGKSDYSSYIEYTWTSNTVTAQEYYGPGEPTYYKTVITFDNNDRMEMIEEWDQPSKAGEWYLYSYTEFTYTNKNLVLTERYYPESVKSGSVREHSFRKSIPSEFPSAKGQLAPFLATRSEATYDSKTNPFIMYPALAILFADDIPYVYTSKNNPTNVSYTDYREGTNTWDVDFTYEFDAKGFPIEVIQYESYDSWSYVETWTISYM